MSTCVRRSIICFALKVSLNSNDSNLCYYFINYILKISFMGGYGSKQSDPKKSKGTDLSGIHKEYMSAYEECKKNPNFFGTSFFI